MIYRYAVLNLAGFAGLASLWLTGLLNPLFAADSLTHMCKVIFVLFLVGLVQAGRLAWKLEAKNDRFEKVKFDLAHKISGVRVMAGRLVMLGIIGTILGFIIALYGGVDPAKVSDVASVGPMIALVLQGIGMAFFKTLTGSVLNLWLMVNYRMLEGEAVRLVQAHGR